MKYDPSLIEVDEIEVNGKKVPFYKIPTGMNGPNGGTISNYEETFTEEEYEEFTSDDPTVYKEFTDYLEEGTDPDTDEVRTYKDDLDLKHAKTSRLLDSIESEEEYGESLEEVDVEVEY